MKNANLLWSRRLLLESGAGAAASLLMFTRANAAATETVMTTLSAYMAGGRHAQTARRGHRKNQTDDPRHAGRDDLGIAIAAGQVRDRFCAQLVRARKWRRSPPPICFAAPSRRHWSTACWPIRMRPTTRIRRRSPIPAASVVPAALAAGERFNAAGETADPRGRARLRHRPPRHHDARQAAIYGGDASQHPFHLGHLRFGRSGGLHGGPDRAADALAPVLHRAIGLGSRLLAARHAAHREGLRFRRHAGAQRHHRGAAGAGGRHRRSMIFLPAPTISSTRSSR